MVEAKPNLELVTPMTVRVVKNKECFIRANVSYLLNLDYIIKCYQKFAAIDLALREDTF